MGKSEKRLVELFYKYKVIKRKPNLLVLMGTFRHRPLQAFLLKAKDEFTLVSVNEVKPNQWDVISDLMIMYNDKEGFTLSIDDQTLIHNSKLQVSKIEFVMKTGVAWERLQRELK